NIRQSFDLGPVDRECRFSGFL
ncbi:hypothetical protein TIFTF001_017569, partial [Ficus carica]